jgi:hypothetical protein
VVEKSYEWADGAKLEEHSRRKHKILREYVFDYLTVCCKLPQQERFRLAIVDGFAGGGRYQCGTPGSPLILNEFFEAAYPHIKHLLEQGRYRSVIFNLDQCGHSHVERNTILDIMHSYPAAEIFYTFVISSLLAFLQKDQPERLRAQLDHLGLSSNDIQALDALMSQKDWLGTAEKIVFDAFRLCAPYVSPFSINNPGGWRYWLIHFANAYRARQVYNNTVRRFIHSIPPQSVPL